jgi:hypothetical protein
MTGENPYAPPVDADIVDTGDPLIEAADHRKLNAVVKDANQFWLAILLCILCSGCGALIIPIWYTVRLLQWNRFAVKYPDLTRAGAKPGSLSAKFQSSQWKLIVGLVFGCLVLVLLAFYIVVLLLFAPQIP